jgi:hypothetical protein
MIDEKWAAEFFGVVGSRRPHRTAEYMAEDVRLQMANMPPTVGIEPLGRSHHGAGGRAGRPRRAAAP